VDFRITPKGTSEVDPLPVRVLAPYGVLSIASVLPVLLVHDAGETRGLYIFAIVNSALYALLFLVIVVQHARENVVRISRRAYHPAIAASLLSLVLLPGIATAERGMDGLESLAWGAGRLSLFEEKYSVAGAGVGGPGLRKITFKPRWLAEEPSHAH
jgi:cellulose synthase (UDP-forming)